MKSFDSQSLNSLSSYNVKDNTINLTTVEINKTNKGYLVDQKLIDILLSGLVAVDFNTFKKDLLADLNNAKNLEELTTRFNNGIYIETVVQKLQPRIEESVEEPKVRGEINYTLD